MNVTKRLFGVLLVVLMMAAPAAAAPILWTNGHYYDVIASGSLAWDDASAWASSLSHAGKQGYLATSTSFSEDAFIASLTGGHVELWLGALQPLGETDPSAGWAWVTGETWAWTNWQGVEPNDNGGPGSEQYLGMWGGGGWNDEGWVPNISGFVVEYGVPEPGTLGFLGLGFVAAALRARRSR
jgi:hypothetical protein